MLRLFFIQNRLQQMLQKMNEKRIYRLINDFPYLHEIALKPFIRANVFLILLELVFICRRLYS